MPIDHNRDPFDTAWRTEAILIRRRLIRLQDETRGLRRMLARKYNPNQPRVPAGHPDGGQWTDGSGGSGGGGSGSFADFGLGLGLGDYGDVFGDAGGIIPAVDPTGDPAGSDPWSGYAETRYDDGSLASSGVSHRDGSRIHSEYAKPGEASDWDERHTVTLPEGEKVTFETSGRTQTIREGGPDGRVVSQSTWEPGGPEPEARVQQTFLPAVVPAAAITVTAGLTLLTWLSARQKLDDLQPAMSLRAREYVPGQGGSIDVEFVGKLSNKEVEQICPRLPVAQSLLDEAIAAVGDKSKYTPQDYGSKVHAYIKRKVDAMNDRTFVAEFSTFREYIENQDGILPRYGQRDTQRTDVHEIVNETTICLYDFKTGKEDLRSRRAGNLVSGMRRNHPLATRFIIMQIKPR